MFYEPEPLRTAPEPPPSDPPSPPPVPEAANPPKPAAKMPISPPPKSVPDPTYESFPVGEHVLRSELENWRIGTLVAGLAAALFLILLLFAANGCSNRGDELKSIYKANPQLEKQFHK